MPKFDVIVVRVIMEQACVSIEAADEAAAEVEALARIKAQPDDDETIEWFFSDLHSMHVIRGDQVTDVIDVTPKRDEDEFNPLFSKEQLAKIYARQPKEKEDAEI
jgi:hypothetical protein